MNLVESWENRMKRTGHQFASIQTNSAFFDRTAIIANLPTILTIQFPKGSSKNKNLSSTHNRSESFNIKQENIPKRDIEKIRYYKD